MSFLTLNGIDVPTLAASVGEVVIGDKMRAFDGTLRSTVRAWKRQWKVSTGPLVVSDAVALKNLIRGQGDVWNFDADAYSAKGQVITGAAPTITASGKFGSYGEFGTNGQQFPLPVGVSGGFGACSFLYWQKRQDGSGWDHFASIQDESGVGIDYKNGAIYGAPSPLPALTNALDTVGKVTAPYQTASWAASHVYSLVTTITPATPNGLIYQCTTAGTSGASAPTWPTIYGATVTDGTVVWTCVGPSAAKLDDVVMLPFTVPSSWLAALAAATVPWTGNPRLTAAGTFVGSGTALVTGEVQDGTINQAVYPISGFGVGQTFDFLLEEV